MASAVARARIHFVSLPDERISLPRMGVSAAAIAASSDSVLPSAGSPAVWVAAAPSTAAADALMSAALFHLCAELCSSRARADQPRYSSQVVLIFMIPLRNRELYSYDTQLMRWGNPWRSRPPSGRQQRRLILTDVTPHVCDRSE